MLPLFGRYAQSPVNGTAVRLSLAQAEGFIFIIHTLDKADRRADSVCDGAALNCTRMFGCC